jgi:hypothetical protein
MEEPPPGDPGRSPGASVQWPGCPSTCGYPGPAPVSTSPVRGPLARPAPQTLVPASVHPPIPCLPGTSLGTNGQVSLGRGPMPAPPPQARPGHSLSESASAPSVRKGGGDTGRLRGCGARGAGRRGLGSLAAVRAQPGGSPARRSLARSGRAPVLLRVRPSASVRECAGGDAGETLLFPLLLLGTSLRPPGRAPPRLAHWEV